MNTLLENLYESQIDAIANDETQEGVAVVYLEEWEVSQAEMLEVLALIDTHPILSSVLVLDDGITALGDFYKVYQGIFRKE